MAVTVMRRHQSIAIALVFYQKILFMSKSIPLKVISTFAFWGETTLLTVELNEGLERIGSQSFEECKSLETITLPSTVKEIGTAAFDGCISLVNVQLNEGLEKIGTSAFLGCESLESITFPSTVKDIGWQGIQLL